MAFQNGTKPAKGNAPNTGSPGKTPAPVRYANPALDERSFVPGYGTNHFTGRSSVDPGQKMTSALADDLKRKAGEGDAGDLLQTIIEGGHALNAQTRTLPAGNVPLAHGMDVRGDRGGGVKVPNKIGDPVAVPMARKP